MQVCYFGTYRANYSRNQIMIEGLRRNGVEVIECHVPLWHGIEDRVQAASGGWLRPAFIMRVVRTYWKLLWAYHRVGNYDVMVLGYPGQFDVYPARILTWLRRKPLVLDVFMSVYLIAQERGITSRSRITALLIHSLEKMACYLPDLLILDTEEYVAWFQQVYNVDPSHFRLVPTGADDRIFRPIAPSGRSDDLFRVLYYGTFIPNHGVQYIIEAARILRGEADIHFELVGDGPEKARAMALAQKYDLTNVTFEGWMNQETLIHRIARADVVLGVFGTTPQSLMTVHNKIYECLAMAKPVITGDSPAARQALNHGEQVYLCERENPASLAEGIRFIKENEDWRIQMGQNGYSVFLNKYDLNHIGQIFRSHLTALLLA